MRKNLLFLLLAMLCCSTTLFAQKKVAFVYQSGYNAGKNGWDATGYDPNLDPIYIGLTSNYTVTNFVYAQGDTPDTTNLITYDLVVMCEAMSGGKNLSNSMKNLVGKVPLLNLKSYVYTSGRWSWAAPTNPTNKTTSVTINTGFESHDIFKGLEVSDGVVQIYDGTLTTSNLVQGFGTLIEGSPIQPENIIANITGTTTSAIHVIDNLEFKYMLIPLSSDLIKTVTPNGVKLVINACNYLMGGGSGGFDPTAPFKIAYLFDSSYSGYCGISKDPIYNNSVIAEKNCEAIDIKSFTATSTDTLAALESKYDLVVVSEAISSSHAFAKPLLSLVNRVPMLNLKSFFYKNTVWNWGAGANPTTVKNNAEAGVTSIIVNKKFAEHALFSDIEVADSTIALYNNIAINGVNKNLVQGYTTTTGSFIEKDDVLAFVKGTTTTYNSIHEHGTTNKYMLLPFSSDALMIGEEMNLTEQAIQLINNAVYYLIESKGKVLQAVKPTFSLSYGNGYTDVTMASLTADAKIYYTTNGSVPTVTSTLYAGPVKVTSNCTVKAITSKQGLDNSAVDSVVVVVKTITPNPAISVASATAGKTVTITGAEGSTLYYTTNGATPSATSNLYSGPFTVTRPCTVKAIATMTDKLNSDVVSEKVSIDGYAERNLTLVWANFYDRPYIAVGDSLKPSYWTWANSDTTTTDNGDVIAKYAYTPPTEADPTLTPTLKTVTFANFFMVGSYGQRINLQKTGVATTGNYSPETDGDAGASDRAMSFLTTNNSADPTTAFMITDGAYAGPFDVAVWFTGAKSATYTEKLEISVAATADASTWTVLDTLSSKGDKLIRKRIAHYDGKESMFVKFKSASNLGTNSNMMIFDVKLFGEGQDPVAIGPKPQIEKTLVSTRVYNLSGIQLKTPSVGVNIIKKIYSDGSVKTEKVIIKEVF